MLVKRLFVQGSLADFKNETCFGLTNDKGACHSNGICVENDLCICAAGYAGKECKEHDLENFPAMASLQRVVSKPGETCSVACARSGDSVTCSEKYFPVVNGCGELRRAFKCKNPQCHQAGITDKQPFYPFYFDPEKPGHSLGTGICFQSRLTPFPTDGRLISTSPYGSVAGSSSSRAMSVVLTERSVFAPVSQVYLVAGNPWHKGRALGTVNVFDHLMGFGTVSANVILATEEETAKS